jgi:hypothetical protein
MPRKLIQQFLQYGLDFSVKSNVRKVAKILGINADMVDRLHIELRNEIDREPFAETDVSGRVLLLPQCLRNSRECKARLDEKGYRCIPQNGCSAACVLYKIKSVGDELGYSTFILPGGSMSMSILKSAKPKALVAVACLEELEMSLTIAGRNGQSKKIRAQLVPLLKNGCRDTLVDTEAVLEALKLRRASKNGVDQS